MYEKVLLVNLKAFTPYYMEHNTLTRNFIPLRHCSCFCDRGMGERHLLDLAGIDLAAGHVYQLLAPVHEEHEAGIRHPADVSSAEPSAGPHD